MKSHKFVGACFAVTLLLFIAACSANNSVTLAPSQNASVTQVADEKITKVADQKTARTLDCRKPHEYSLVVVANPKRMNDSDPTMPKDLNIVIGDEVIAKLELPKGDVDAKNFSLGSVEKTKAGFEVKADWGGGINHYEIQFNFRCKENHFYLYKVRRDSFSTRNPDSGSFLDIKRTKVIRVKPNLPIEKVVMTDYLR